MEIQLYYHLIYIYSITIDIGVTKKPNFQYFDCINIEIHGTNIVNCIYTIIK